MSSLNTTLKFKHPLNIKQYIFRSKMCGYLFQYHHMGSDTAVVTQKIFQLISLTNAVSICCLVLLHLLVLKNSKFLL